MIWGFCFNYYILFQPLHFTALSALSAANTTFPQLADNSAAVLLNSRLQVSSSKTSHMGSWGNVGTWMVSYSFDQIWWKRPRSKGSQIGCYNKVATLSRCMSRKNNNFESMKWTSYFLTFLKVLINFGLIMKLNG